MQGLGAELEALEDQVRDKRAEHEAAVLQLDAQEAELHRLTLLHQEAIPTQPSPCPTTAAIMALLTPERATRLLGSLALLQVQMGLASASAGAPPGKSSVPPTPTGGDCDPTAQAGLGHSPAGRGGEFHSQGTVAQSLRQGGCSGNWHSPRGVHNRWAGRTSGGAGHGGGQAAGPHSSGGRRHERRALERSCFPPPSPLTHPPP